MLAQIATVRKTRMKSVDLLNKIRQEPNDDLANDLGVIFFVNGCSIAEGALTMMLHATQPKLRFIAYCHLVRADRPLSQKTHDELRLFISRSENISLVEDAKNKLWLGLN